MKALLQLALTSVLMATCAPSWGASATAATAATAATTTATESEAMRRERALNRILVGERQQREKEMAAQGSGLMGIKPAAQPKPAASTADQAKKNKKGVKRRELK